MSGKFAVGEKFLATTETSGAEARRGGLIERTAGKGQQEFLESSGEVLVSSARDPEVLPIAGTGRDGLVDTLARKAAETTGNFKQDGRGPGEFGQAEDRSLMTRKMDRE